MKNINKYSEYFNKKLEAYKVEKGRARISEKLIKEFLSDKKTAAALQKNVRRYYQRGDIIDFNNIPQKARPILKEAVKLERTIETQRTAKKLKEQRQERARKKAETAPTFAIQGTGSNFYFLDGTAQDFTKKLQEGQGYEVRKGINDKAGPRYSSEIIIIDATEAGTGDPNDAESWKDAERVGQNLKQALINKKQGNKFPVYEIYLIYREDGLIDIGLYITDYIDETP